MHVARASAVEQPSDDHPAGFTVRRRTYRPSKMFFVREKTTVIIGMPFWMGDFSTILLSLPPAPAPVTLPAFRLRLPNPSALVLSSQSPTFIYLNARSYPPLAPPHPAFLDIISISLPISSSSHSPSRLASSSPRSSPIARTPFFTHSIHSSVIFAHMHARRPPALVLPASHPHPQLCLTSPPPSSTNITLTSPFRSSETDTLPSTYSNLKTAAFYSFVPSSSFSQGRSFFFCFTSMHGERVLPWPLHP
ncbi:hypothetical protein C8R44DRAFT_879637 [Mycena epipterygia]|nr:hypothetical protein C8R44DRAFT_879637 [Mycena epipterygia]